VPQQQTEHRLIWADRKGEKQAIPAPPRGYLVPRLSPDGRAVAVAIEEERHDVWTYDLNRGTLSRLTFEARNYSPEWSPGGRRVTFGSTRTGSVNLFWKPVVGSPLVEPLVEGEYFKNANSWAADGQTLAYRATHPDTGEDIWLYDLQERQSHPYLVTPFDEEEAMFSPDGRWMAFQSNESGRTEIYLGRYPGTGERWQISTEGGFWPRWSRSGKEIFYLNGPKLMVVEVNTEGAPTLGRPKLLFENLSLRQGYDVSPDGQRFIMVEEAEPKGAQVQLILVQNWFEELKRLVPVN
jgi:Tol biopolymer transport system component